MSFFSRPHYVSPATSFINDLKAANPQLEAEQRAGRELLWDKQINPDQRDQAQAARVAQKPYVYQTKSDLV
jgi:hypothetical protein